MMSEILMVVLCTTVALFFAFFVPIYLRKSSKIKPTKNVFFNYVDNDHGYPWSWSQERKESFKQALTKRTK